jgi:hypothetical protein
MFKNKAAKGQPTIITSPKVIQNITPEIKGGDLFAIELHDFCELFDNMINISNEKNIDNCNLKPVIKKNLLTKIISNFQIIIFFFLNPKQTNRVPQSPLGNSPIYDFIQPANVFIDYYELEITDKEVDMLRENIMLLNNEEIPDQETENNQQDQNLSQENEDENDMQGGMPRF